MLVFKSSRRDAFLFSNSRLLLGMLTMCWDASLVGGMQSSYLKAVKSTGLRLVVGVKSIRDSSSGMLAHVGMQV